MGQGDEVASAPELDRVDPGNLAFADGSDFRHHGGLFSHYFTQGLGRAGRSILLVDVMCFGDVNIVAMA